MKRITITAIFVAVAWIGWLALDSPTFGLLTLAVGGTIVLHHRRRRSTLPNPTHMLDQTIAYQKAIQHRDDHPF